MATDFENFKSWYADTLLKLYPDRNSGFVILMVVFPLLERYLRHKNGLSHRDNLTDGCMDELSKMFPPLPDRKTARNFWNVYRNVVHINLFFHISTFRVKAFTNVWFYLYILDKSYYSFVQVLNSIFTKIHFSIVTKFFHPPRHTEYIEVLVDNSQPHIP